MSLSPENQFLFIICCTLLQLESLISLQIEHIYYICYRETSPGGEIGRRASLRGWWPFGCSGSSPDLGTLIRSIANRQCFFCICILWITHFPKLRSILFRASFLCELIHFDLFAYTLLTNIIIFYNKGGFSYTHFRNEVVVIVKHLSFKR